MTFFAPLNNSKVSSSHPNMHIPFIVPASYLFRPGAPSYIESFKWPACTLQRRYNMMSALRLSPPQRCSLKAGFLMLSFSPGSPACDFPWLHLQDVNDIANVCRSVPILYLPWPCGLLQILAYLAMTRIGLLSWGRGLFSGGPTYFFVRFSWALSGLFFDYCCLSTPPSPGVSRLLPSLMTRHSCGLGCIGLGGTFHSHKPSLIFSKCNWIYTVLRISFDCNPKFLHAFLASHSFVCPSLARRYHLPIPNSFSSTSLRDGLFCYFFGHEAIEWARLRGSSYLPLHCTQLLICLASLTRTPK